MGEVSEMIAEVHQVTLPTGVTAQSEDANKVADEARTRSVDLSSSCRCSTPLPARAT